ncbi:MAG TPA: hypothetical protein VIH72_07010 [Candidatus Acidoferrales bacterium]
MRRSIALAIFSLVSILPASLLAQQSTQTPPTPQRDPQAVALLNQSLTTAGGAQALATVLDFTAAGKITYYWTEKGEQGTVSVKSRGASQFRMDATISEGVLTGVMNNGLTWTKETNGTIRQLPNQHTDNAGNKYLPFAEIAAALANPTISITDLGLVTEGGQQAHGIRLQKTFSGLDDSSHTRAKLAQRDVFIDATTFLVVRTRDLSPTRSNLVPSVPHDVVFSNYRTLNGVLFPYSVSESLNSQQLVAIQFDTVKFNSGLGDTDFQQ